MSEELETLITGDRKQRGCCSKHPVACSVVLGVLGGVCLAVVVCGALLHSTIDDKVQDAIAEQVKLKNGSAATDQFIHTKAPMYTTYFFYNVTNAKDVVKNGHKPNLVQLGPYAYKENRTCFDLRWHDNDSVLEYKTSVTYTFDPTVSVGNPDTDKVTTINMPLMGFFKEVEGIGGKAVDAALEAFDYMKMKFDWWDDGVFTKRTVSELLFGYDDPMLLSIKNDIHLLQKLHLVHRNLSIDPRFNYSHRSTVEEPNLVYTGVQNLSRANEYIMWNGNYNMSSWNNTWASAINGTGGYAFHPQVTKDEVLNVFIDEVYRSGYFKYDSEILDHGIKLYKYVLPQDELLNSTQRQYGFPSDNPSGVLNLTPNFDPPVEMFASKPHFLDADSVYRENVTGMSPNRSIHDSYMGVEPITGAVLNAAKRIQLNINVRRSSIFPELKKVRDVTMLPIYYGEQTGKVTSELANEFKAKVYAIKYGISGGVWAVVGVAGLVLVVSVMCFIGMMGQVIRHKISHRSYSQYTSLNSS